MLTRAEIVEILKREVYAADARLRDARWKVDAILADIPGVLPQADGNERITMAINEQRKAREALKLAVSRNLGFTLDGIVPEDLK